MARDKERQKEMQHRSYLRTKETHYSRSALRARKLVAWIGDYKIHRGGCLLCPETHPWALEFHHPDPTVKEGCISGLAARMNGIVLMREMEKCFILCSNCHRKEHYQIKMELPSLISITAPITLSDENEIIARLREFNYPFQISPNKRVYNL